MPRLRLLFPVLLAFLQLNPVLFAGVGASNVFSVDTRTGQATASTITGIVVDGTSPTGPYQPLAGATVTLNGNTVTTGADGRFSFRVTLDVTFNAIASKTGFVPASRSVGPVVLGKSLDTGIIVLRPESAGPSITSVYLTPDGLMVQGWRQSITAFAQIDWKNFNPLDVEFFANGKSVSKQTLNSSVYTQRYYIDSDFVSSLERGVNTVKVIARGSLKTNPSIINSSAPSILVVSVLPLPQCLGTFLSNPANVSEVGENLKLKITLPATKPFGAVSVPILGTLGGEASASGEFSYNTTSGQWTLEIGGKAEGESTKYSKFKLKLGGLDKVSAEIKGTGKGTATLSSGIDLSSIDIEAQLGLEKKFPLGSYIIGAGFLNAGAVKILEGIPLISAVLRTATVNFEARPSISGSTGFSVYPQLDFKNFELSGKLPLEAVYEPISAKWKIKFYAGGEPSLTFQYPGEFFKEFKGKLYAGLNIDVWVFEKTAEWVFLDYTFPARRLPAGAIPIEGGYLIPAAANDTATWAPMQRPWLDSGGESFLLAQPSPGRRLSAEAEAAQASLDAFARMGETPSAGAVAQPTTGPGRRLSSDPGLPAQAELPLLANVFPDSEPALAAKGTQLMLLYVKDSGVANPVQFTQIGYTYFNGTTWTTPAPLATDARGQFTPKVCFDGNGDAVTVYERIKDAAFAGTTPELIAPQMEIVWSRWDAIAKTWSAPIALTDNAFLDFKPQLAGPLTDGDLILTWNRNLGNSLSGTTAAPMQVMTARWDAATKTWGTPEVLVDGLVGELGESLAAGGNRAVYVWSRDLNGDLTDTADSELFHRDYNGTTWAAAVRDTTDATADRNPRAWVDASANAFVVWNQNGVLSLRKNFTGAPTVARDTANNLGLSDFALTGGPGGNLVLLWQEMSENGSDAHYRVFDPASSTWGLDTLMSADSDLERSFAPVWDAAGNLTVAYNNVTVTKQTVTVAVAGGGTETVEGVPQPGAVSLLVAKRAIVRDLEISAGALTAEGTAFLPGNQVTLKATVHNSGNVPLSAVAVRFYDGDPANGGTAITTITLPNLLASNDSATVTYTWTLPSPAASHSVFAVVDPAAAVSEFSETNNTQSILIGGVDLSVSYKSGTVLRDGSVRMVVDVANLAAPASPIAELRLENAKAAAGTPALATQMLAQIEPGATNTFIFDLPAGSHAQGETVYRVVADAGALTGDVDTSNNSVSTSLLLWIDDDGDSLPQVWEAANGLSDSTAADAAQDLDGDGFTNAQEYLAGTNPRNATDFLKLNGFNVVSLPAVGGLRNSFSWASASGTRYDVQRSFDVKTWETIATEVPATPPLNTLVDEIPGASKQVFYRLIAK